LNSKDLRLKLEVMGSLMTGDQFTVEVLNSLTRDYKILMVLLHKQIGNKNNPLTVGELSLRYERLSSKT
jgi:hypothetical protein